MSTIRTIKIEEYNYPLPNGMIARFPLENRDGSKLLFQSGSTIEEKRFVELPRLLPPNALLIFNETKVVKARLLFKKDSGATIEIFCLEPVEPVNDFQLAFQQKSPVIWKCLVGNSKRWKSGKLKLEFSNNGKIITLFAEKIKKLTEGFHVAFQWENNEITFSEIINHSGLVPIPPYLNREADENDSTRYQTIYAEYEGSVAAPTAGLHFTLNILNELRNAGFETDKLTLHVGAGTFKPVVSHSIAEHEMHTEKIVVSIQTLKHLREKLCDPVIPVGTTSMRTLESLFWMAVKLGNGNDQFVVDQWDPYEIFIDTDFNAKQALTLLISYLEDNKQNEIKGETRLMIAPGYKFRIAKGLITNFHQPKSTLLLLVSALIGDSWKKSYDFALNNDFRFLSYGDSCLFLP
ncbi:MAG: S-adenosylmethionine:tRNA ribosyltransferase-isomerase [Bacteroidetes bacterium]|nr:S-adenosylmethionine:tRNA ribosyltransferase-isomerase [Bacteroidota bacterium]MBL6943602.1 S-adenosylmethionine:tRNA ribosyltransferase-isomerase [Bacteroidales bacterium]